MWTRLIAKILAMVGLYAVVVAGLSMRFSGQKNAGSFNMTMGELAAVTVVFLALTVFVVTRRPRQPLD